MTEYWVSQGNKWCDVCKIYISNNPSSIRNHELGTRHKENVTKRLATMRKENAAKDKEHKETANALVQIEAKAERSYLKDKAKFEEARESHELDSQGEWEFDSSSGYYYHKTNGFCYDQKSGFYYSDAIGKWVTHDEAYASPHFASNAERNVPSGKKGKITLQSISDDEYKPNKHHKGTFPVRVNPMRNAKTAAASSLAVGKRKRPNEKPKVISQEEKEALKAREAARKRVEQREKPLLGLYNKPY